MRAMHRTTQFKKDIQRMQRRKKCFYTFKQIIRDLARGHPLGVKHRNFPLSGTYQGTRECHIEPDWLLIYERTDSDLYLIQTGTHLDLFR